jgi:hypothetical protein
LELVTMFKIDKAGFRNRLEDMRDVKTKDLSSNFVGSLDIADTSRGGLDGAEIATSWNPCLVERCRRKSNCLAAKLRGFNRT